MNYLELLKNSYEVERHIDECPPDSRLEYLGDHIFGFTTYDGAMSALFAQRAIEVSGAISARATFDYIKDEENYQWFLLMCNLPFFSTKIEWGCSIRGAWWDNTITFRSLGLWDGDNQIVNEMTFTNSDWELFMSAVSEFSKAQDSIKEV
jgi:hypothetical protein